MIISNNEPMGALGTFSAAVSQTQKGVINNLLKPGQTDFLENKTAQSRTGIINNPSKPGQTDPAKNGKNGLDVLA